MAAKLKSRHQQNDKNTAEGANYPANLYSE